MLLRDFIIDGARLHSDRIALVGGGRHVAYADLDRKADRLAAALAGNGVKAGDRVVVYMDNCVDAVVALLAVLKASAVFTPVDAAADGDELAFVFDDCRAVAVVTQARLGSVAAAAMRKSCSVRLVVLAGGDQSSAPNCLSFEDVVNRPARAAVRTVGTAGQALMLAYPHGGAGLYAPVTLTHTDMAAAVAACRNEVASAPRVGVQPISGARGVARVLAALMAGVTLMPCPPIGDGGTGAAAGAA